MGQEDLEFDNRINTLSSQLQHLSWSSLLSCGACSLSASGCSDVDYGGQLKLIIQAQALLTKNILYQKVDVALRQLSACQPGVYKNVARSTTSNSNGENEVISAAQRDVMVANVRFLNIFYNYRHDTFAHAVQLLDMLLGQVKIHPRFISSVATCCFYIAAKANELPALAPNPRELVALSQCGITVGDLLYTERLIYETLAESALQGTLLATPLTFLRLFYQIVSVESSLLQAEKFDLALLISKLEVILCQFEFTRFRADMLALVLISCVIHDYGTLNSSTEAIAIAELQYYCQMSEAEFWDCRRMVLDYLAMYQCQPTKLPRLQLSWSVSRRTLHKMKPSTRAAQDLEPIMEDEDGNCLGLDNDGDESSIFDSENDDVATLGNERSSLSDDQMG
jgi:hypothetical protein